ncbi:DUF2953 domain-containing protein, partial [Blautia sp.]|uniref:DUF2953 domain-containing protein n=1 Tax=Blautia sp. TaxID=1955243 RepID=UPI002E788A66
GILLLIVLGILLLAVLAALFCPVTYSAVGRRDAEAYEGRVRIGWLFRLISFTFTFESEKDGDFCIRIFGIPLNRKKEEASKKSLQTSQRDEFKPADPEKIVEKKTEQEHGEKTEKEAERKIETDSVLQKLQEFLKQIPGIPKKFLDVLKKISLTVHHICDKINQIKEFLESERFARLKALFFQEGKRTICHIRPRKIKGHIKIGTGDPYRTGQLLAVAGIFFPVYGEHITIEPYFEQKILEGNMSVKGRIYGSFFVRLAWRLFRDSDIRFMIKKIKRG